MKKMLTLIGLAALACSAVAATAVASGNRNTLYQFRGEVVSANPTSLQLTVEGGNRAGLRAMLGQVQNQTFALGTTTEILVWTKGVPKVGGVGDLHTGDWVQLNVRAPFGASLADIEAKAVGIVGDHVNAPTPPSLPLFLYVGTVAGPQSGGHIALTVKAGNRRALRTMIGQSADQSFTYDDNTIFLLWQGKVPTVIDPSQLKAGDRITVRIRAPFRSSLAQVEASPARHVGDHEPAQTSDAVSSL
jgi:hypothetical protein